MFVVSSNKASVHSLVLAKRVKFLSMIALLSWTTRKNEAHLSIFHELMSSELVKYTLRRYKQNNCF